MTPSPPDYTVAWDLLLGRPEIARLEGCPQDAVHHAEGDVAVHTRLVCEALAALPAWRALPEPERSSVFSGALYHDVGKPDRTREEEGRISSRGHSRRGEILARVALWRAGVPLRERESICGLVRWHQVPYFLLERPDAAKLVHRISQSTRCDHLALVAEADVRGRVCADRDRLLDNVALFAVQADDEGCLSAPRLFPSTQSRFEYFRTAGRSATHAAHDDSWGEVVILAGLPGAGKDTFAARRLAGLPVVSLDAVRRELDVDPEDRQGVVVARAEALVKDQLRAKRPFVLSATNLSRDLRGKWVALAAAYGARVRIVYLEASEEELRSRNRSRAARVPERAIARMLDRWEVPDPTEAHSVEWYDAADL